MLVLQRSFIDFPDTLSPFYKLSFLSLAVHSIVHSNVIWELKFLKVPLQVLETEVDFFVLEFRSFFWDLIKADMEAVT